MRTEQVFLSPLAGWLDILGGLRATGVTLLLLLYGRKLQFSILRLQEGLGRTRAGSGLEQGE